MAQFDTNPGDRSVAELEHDVNREREHLADTIDALKQKATISHVVDEVVRAVSENGGEFSRNLGRSLRDNPLPALLTSVGLAWMMASGGTPRRRWDYEPEQDDYDDSSSGGGMARRTYPAGMLATGAPAVTSGDADEDRPGFGERALEAGSAVRDRASRAASGLSESMSDFQHAAGERMSAAGDAMRGAGDAMRSGAHGARRRVVHAGRGARDGFTTMLDEQPLALGAIALALGAAVGGALPRSGAEDRMFGAQSDRAMRNMREMAEEQARKARATVGVVAEEARAIAGETAEELGQSLPGGREMVDKAEARLSDAAARLRDAAVDEAERQNLGKAGETSSA